MAPNGIIRSLIEKAVDFEIDLIHNEREVFNLFNTFNWGNPETNFNAGTFGRITSMAGSGPNAFGPPATPRIMQFAIKYRF